MVYIYIKPDCCRVYYINIILCIGIKYYVSSVFFFWHGSGLHLYILYIIIVSERK